jgi:hypothetical protein
VKFAKKQFAQIHGILKKEINFIIGIAKKEKRRPIKNE